MKKKKKAIYMYVSADKYEIPLAIADSADELAEMLGVTRNAIDSSMSNARRRGNKCQYKRVLVDAEEGDEDES